jgi:agmatine deiminase
MKRRLPAEWEPQSAVQFTFPHAATDWADILDEVIPCFVNLIETVSRFETVLVICREPDEVQGLLQHVPKERLRLGVADSNDTWARDHGAVTVFENGQPVLYDFMFNGWGLKFPADKDNLITGKLYRQSVFNKLPLVRQGLILEGGAIESDGQGTLLTTTTCLLSPNRNPHLTKEALTRRLKELFGLHRVLWLHYGYLAGDDTDAHIDTLARFCDPATIAYVQCANPEDEHFDALQAMESELRTFRTLKGNPYRLLPLPMPEAIHDEQGRRLPATYANFLIVNGAVLAPTYQVAQDQAALEQLQEAFPEREVIGLDCRPLIRQHGSLHCVTMHYPEGVVS